MVYDSRDAHKNMKKIISLFAGMWQEEKKEAR